MPDAPGAAGGGANFLTRKFGPLPVWVYALGAGALVTLIALYKRGGTAGATAAPAGTAASDASGVLNYPPTVVVTPAGMSNYQPATSTTTPNGSSATVGGFQVMTSARPTDPGTNFPLQGSGTIPFFSDPGGSNQIGWLPWSTPLTVTGPATLGRDVFGSKTWYPILYGSQQGYISANSISGFQGTPGSGGGGGFGSGAGLGGLIHTRIAAGSRVGHFSPFQPSQYVRAGGGAGLGGADGYGAGDGGGDGFGEGYGAGGPGGRAMNSIARRTGIPLQRLMSLNYHLRTPRGTYGPGNVRVA